MSAVLSVRNRVIVVLGMHRSGTSAIVKSLELLGVGLSENLHPAGFDNPKGFWEDRDCLDINEKLLAHFGSAYDGIHLEWNDILIDPVVEQLMQRAITIVAENLKKCGGVWGFKDPRTCRLLDFWSKVFSAVGADVGFVIAVRNPASVAASLEKRNKFPTEKSYLLWLQHVLPALTSTKGSLRIVVDFDEFLKSAYQQLTRIASRLHLTLPDRESKVIQEFEQGFLDKGLRHSRFTEDDLASDTSSSKLIANTYRLCHKLAIDEEYLESRKTQSLVNRLNGQLQDASVMFDYIHLLENERTALWHAINERDEISASLHKAVSARDELITSLNATVSNRDQQTINVDRVVSERDEQLTRLDQAIGERDEQIAKLQQTIGARDELIATLNATVSQRDEQAINLDRAVTEREEQIASLGQLLAEEQTQVTNLSEIVTKRGKQIVSLDQTVGERDKQVASLQQTIGARDELIVTLNATVGNRDKQIINLDRTVTERDEQLTRLDQAIGERDEQIAKLQQMVGARDIQVASLVQTVGVREEEIASLGKLLEEEKRRVTNLNETVTKRDKLIVSLDKAAGAREEQIVSLSRLLAEEKRQVTNLNETVTKRDEQIVSLDQALNQQIANFDRVVQELNSILGSNSWALTRPFRFIRHFFLREPYRLARSGIERVKQGIRVRVPLRFKLLGKSLSLIHPVEFYRARLSRLSGKYVPLRKSEPLQSMPVKLIAFYLPQFHEIPENNEWWGQGFTEWTNVRVAQPQFEGHYQPRIPDGLGYYNLLDPSIQHLQVELAKLYGIGGFCFYTYWFGSKLLLEKPVENYLNDSSLDLPFCLCWANENWNRRWDGLENDILIAQSHSAEDDIAFIKHVARYMIDERYIRISGKPVLLVYRPSLLPSARETAQRWRDWCSSNGIGDIYLAYTQSFEVADPAEYGFDAAVEFPPNNSAPPIITDRIEPLTDEFNGIVYDWRVFLERSEKYKQTDYRLLRSVCPSWDNTARRKYDGAVFLNSTPELYQQWLENAIDDTLLHVDDPEERLVFVNAWNEWAEGAYLEPDSYYGYAYLQATSEALNNSDLSGSQSILLVTHDCHPHGAQFLILQVANQLAHSGFKVAVLALGGGPLREDFAQFSNFFELNETNEVELDLFLTELRARGVLDAITSTVVSGRIVPKLKELGFGILSLIHEQPGVIRDMRQEDNAKTIAEHADKLVFPAKLVHQQFCEIATVAQEKVLILPQGVLRKNPYKNRSAEAYHLICERHNLDRDTRIVLSVAYVDFRKGPDLFVEMAAKVLKKEPNTTFIWVGHVDSVMMGTVSARIKALRLDKQVLFVGFDREPLAYYAAASVYALTSREDPFPNVVLESIEVNVPVVAFQGASGAGDFIVEHGGALADYLDTADFADKVCEIFSRSIATSLGTVQSLRQYSLDLLHSLNGFPRVTVVVPNYNYGHVITKRLDSIFEQKFPIYEVIVLDDASSDNSVDVIETYQKVTGNEFRLIVNDTNSGSVFRQWTKGVELCKGDLVWIAEADDLAYTGFLGELCCAFLDPEVVLSFCQSIQMDENGNTLAYDYLDYTNPISKCWQSDYVRDGKEEIGQALSVKNTIPNVSAVVFRRNAIETALSTVGDSLFDHSTAGDWLVYIHTLLQGKISFNRKSLNLHCRHSGSIIQKTDAETQMNEIIRLQAIARSFSNTPKVLLQQANDYIEYLHEYFGANEQSRAKTP